MKAILSVVVFLFGFNSALAASSATNTSSSTLGKEKHKVDVMLLMDKIFNINLSTSSYDIEAEIILKWVDHQAVKTIKNKFPEHTLTGDRFHKAMETIWHPEFVVSNELMPRITDFKTLKVYDDGTLEVFEKFVSQIAIDADIHEYPFGEIDLTLDISAFTHEANEMVLNPVYFEIGHGDENEQVVKGPWQLANKYVKQEIDQRLSSHEALFSHNKFHFVLTHDFMDSLQKVIFPIGAVMLFSTFMNFFASLKFGPNADWRIGGQITLILTLFALKFSLADEIPVTHYLNFIDELFIIATIVVGLNLLTSVVINNMYQRNPDGAAASFELTYKVLQPIIMIAMLMWAVYSIFFGFEPPSGGGH